MCMGYSDEELNWIHQRTLENIVVNYRKDLLNIHRNKECRLNDNDRNRLRGYGLINFGRRHSGDWRLTPKCIQLLKTSKLL